MIANGLLAFGKRILVPGLTIVGPDDDPDCQLDGGDYTMRGPHDWIRQIIVHTTQGKSPTKVVPGAGRGGRARATANFWRTSTEGKNEHGGAPLIVDDDGVIWCLCDLAKIAAYHATTSNAWSIGIEMFQTPDGTITQATLDATVKLVTFLCDLFGVAKQIPSRAYNGDAIDRMKFNGGPDMVGVFGHRDNAWDFIHKTSSRGRGDPGDDIYKLLELAGFEPLAFERRDDIAVWKRRQQHLNERHDAHLLEDGIAGPGTNHALVAAGYANGRAIDAAMVSA